jgi:hypothetical protein
MKEQWTDIWPTKEGTYWFYGFRFGDRSHEPLVKGGKPFIDKPELHLVQVWKISNGFSYVATGNFMYKAEGAIGKWIEAILPELPIEN